MNHVGKRLLAVSVLAFVGTSHAFRMLDNLDPTLTRRDAFRATTTAGWTSAMLIVASPGIGGHGSLPIQEWTPWNQVFGDQRRHWNNEAATSAKGQDQLLVVLGWISRRWRKACR